MSLFAGLLLKGEDVIGQDGVRACSDAPVADSINYVVLTDTDYRDRSSRAGHVILFRFACPACALIRSFAFELDQSSIVVSYKSTYWPKRFVQ